jgi:cytochrome P450
MLIKITFSDVDHFPEPHKFNPDRNFKENRAYMGFGDGPRRCIGQTFGIMQVKCGIARIMSRYTVKTCEQTDIPEVFSKTTFNRQPANGLVLKFVKRNR